MGDVTNIEGFKKHYISTELTSSVALTLLLGVVEIVLTVTEMGCSTTGGLKICSTKQDIVVVLMVVFQFLETLMTWIDFTFVTLEAQSKSDQLFNPDSATATYDAWCTGMVNTSAICMGEKRNMSVSLLDDAVDSLSIKDSSLDTRVKLTVVIVIIEILVLGIGVVAWYNKALINRYCAPTAPG